MDNQQQRFPKGKNVQRLSVLYLMKYILYLTTNLINNKKYAGVHKTENPDIFDGYLGCGVSKKDLKKNVKVGFPAAVHKYGYENFKREVLKVFPCTEEGKILVSKAEEELVDEKWVKDPNTYNLVKGGIIPPYDVLKKKIVQYDLEGHFLRVWNSITEAELELNLTSIFQALSGKSRYCGEWQWKYYIDESSYDDIAPTSTKEKVIYQFDLQGNLLKVWKSITLASQIFDNPNSAKTAIWNVCNKITRQAFGYYWSYKSKFEFNPYNGCTAVASYKDDGTFIKSYTSLKEAAQEYNLKTTSNIIACIKGKQKRCGGVRWRYYYGNNENIKSL